MAKKSLLSSILVAALLLYGCMTAAEHQQSLGSTQERETTVGVVQKEIHKGMSQADVAEALGSPNIVTKDSEGKETWIYDKIASEASYSRSAGGTGLIINLFGGYGKEAGAVSSTQKTLTVVIKYDDAGRVESFSYHASKF
jgi:outer membrane protein assembly factor BamE (lipoprotein component of BamABCDE complex)